MEATQVSINRGMDKQCIEKGIGFSFKEEGNSDTGNNTVNLEDIM